MIDYFKIYKIAYNASEEVIKSKYRQLALEWHPDKNPHRVVEATEKFKQISLAFEKLLDPQYRIHFAKKKTEVPPLKKPSSFSIVDAPPPKTDLWGRPLSPKEKEMWDRANKADLRKINPKDLEVRNDGFIDTQTYESDSFREIR